MNPTEVKRRFLHVFIGFLGLTALMAIQAVLAGEFGEIQLKILATTFTISAASICSMSCAAFMERRSPAELGLAGIVLCGIAAVLLILGLWTEIDGEGYWKTMVTFGVLAVASANVFLLILPRLDANQKWVQVVSSLSIGLLALLVIAAVWIEVQDPAYFRILAVVAIIVGLETLVTPILVKLRKGNGRKKERLTLEKIEEDLYRDSAGNTYQVSKIVPK